MDDIDFTKRVQVYYNLHKRLFSVKQGGRVVLHVHHVHLKDARFLVQQAGRARTIREGVKNVHAYVTGYLTDPSEYDAEPYRLATYNPFRYDHFVFKDTERPVLCAPFVSLENDIRPAIQVYGR